MTDNAKSAKDRKLAAKRRSAQAVADKKGGKGRSPVVVYSRSPMSENDIERNRQAAHKVEMAKPKPLSAQARFDMLKPPNIHPFDWVQLFTSDEALWPDIVEEALAAQAEGEIEPYDGPVRGG